MPKCIICDEEVEGNGGTEIDGVRYPMHENCYKNSTEDEVRAKIQKAKNKEVK